MEKKVLTLTVSKQWFDMIAADEKTEEYREIKPYGFISKIVDSINRKYEELKEIDNITRHLS